MTLELSALGWSPFFEEQWQEWSGAGCIPARIAAEHRGAYEVWSPAGRGAAQVAGRLRRALAEGGLPAAGDWVAIDAPPGPDRPAQIRGLLQRRTLFTRLAAGRGARLQVVAANVDLVLAVCGLDADFNLRRIERYLARIGASGARPLVVLNKADLAEEPAARVREVVARIPGAEVLPCSARRGDGVAALRERIAPGTTAALVGSSGAGKSTLVNALGGAETMATGEVRARDGRGQHVTTRRQLVELPGGGLLLDTPGMRELQLAGEEGLEAAFEEVAALAAGCRFADCGHEGEPGCALQAALEDGSLDPERLEHFLRLGREARAAERRRDARLRRQDERAWGRLTGEAHRQMRRKRGEE
ncbi:MAG: ribosome small subunit-dependent GTPase A [Deltaproteobacteria bacterium]|nr:ribosome small subunit-dependent GTPase A [Deltaproteobacteria bacterium]